MIICLGLLLVNFAQSEEVTYVGEDRPSKVGESCNERWVCEAGLVCEAEKVFGFGYPECQVPSKRPVKMCPEGYTFNLEVGCLPPARKPVKMCLEGYTFYPGVGCLPPARKPVKMCGRAEECRARKALILLQDD